MEDLWSGDGATLFNMWTQFTTEFYAPYLTRVDRLVDAFWSDSSLFTRWRGYVGLLSADIAGGEDDVDATDRMLDREDGEAGDELEHKKKEFLM